MTELLFVSVRAMAPTGAFASTVVAFVVRGPMLPAVEAKDRVPVVIGLESVIAPPVMSVVMPLPVLMAEAAILPPKVALGPKLPLVTRPLIMVTVPEITG